MSGGVAYVFDPNHQFPQLCNLEMVDLDKIETPEDEDAVVGLLTRHVQHTGSTVATRLLEGWSRYRADFVKVMPRDYKAVLKAIAHARQAGLPEEQAIMEAAHG